MSWIRTIAVAEAGGRLKALYDLIKGSDDNVDNIMAVHSLRPHTMQGHMALYKATLHHPGNTLPEWFLELIGVLVSDLNRCGYCVEHHSAGLQRLLADDGRHASMLGAIGVSVVAAYAPRGLDEPNPVLDTEALSGLGLTPGMLALLDYAATLTLAPASLSKGSIAQLRAAGVDEGEILEVNQVAAYFAYANRTVLGLGVNTEGDTLGLSPGSTDADTWEQR